MLSLEHADPYERVERLGPIRDLDAHTAGASLLTLPTTQYPLGLAFCRLTNDSQIGANLRVCVASV
jgi:hypothetical protein